MCCYPNKASKAGVRSTNINKRRSELQFWIQNKESGVQPGANVNTKPGRATISNCEVDATSALNISRATMKEHGSLFLLEPIAVEKRNNVQTPKHCSSEPSMFPRHLPKSIQLVRRVSSMEQRHELEMGSTRLTPDFPCCAQDSVWMCRKSERSRLFSQAVSFIECSFMLRLFPTCSSPFSLLVSVSISCRWWKDF